MVRLLVITVSLAGFVLGGGGAALASTQPANSTQICLVTSNDPSHTQNTYYCVTV